MVRTPRGYFDQLLSARGVSDEEFWARQLPFLEEAMASGRYPAMAALAEDTFAMSWEQTFDWGLARLLDGIETLVTDRRRRRRPPK